MRLLTVLGAVLAAAAVAPALADTPGTNIGNAAVLSGTVNGTLASSLSDDWYVVYPQSTTTPVVITVTDTVPSSSTGGCHDIDVSVEDTRGDVVAGSVFGSNQGNAADPFSVTEAGSDRFYVEVTDDDCNPAGGPDATYELTLDSGGGGPAPSPSAGSAAPGTSIGNAGPLVGDTSTTGTLADSSADDWFVLEKAAGSGQGTVRVEDTSVLGSTCRDVDATLYNEDGDVVDGAVLGGNTAQVFATSTAGEYYLELTDDNCNPGTGGAATFAVEPEPASEWTNPTILSAQAISGGATLAAAAGPLIGGLQYTDTVPNASTQEWFAVNLGANGVVSVDDTALRAATCADVDETLENASGDVVGGSTLGSDTGAQDVVTNAGTYYLQVDDDNCNPGANAGVPFTIEVQGAVTSTSPPTCQDASASTTSGTAVTFTLSCSGGTAPLSYQVLSAPAHGQVTVNAATGQATYTPAAGYVGSDSFTFNVGDATGLQSAAATATITVALAGQVNQNQPNTPAPSPPTCQDASASTTSGTAVTFTLSCSGGTAPLSYQVLSAPAHGQVTVNAATGQATYTPAAGYVGSDSFTFNVGDARGLQSAAATATITVALAGQVNQNQTNPPAPSPSPTSGATQLSGAGLQALADFEGLHGVRKDGRSYPIDDGYGNCTVGYGQELVHQGPCDPRNPHVAPYMHGETQLQAFNNMKATANAVAAGIVTAVGRPLAQNQLDALVIFKYNAPAYSRKLIRLIRENASTAKITSFINSINKANDRQTGRLVVSPGLVTRRAQEVNLLINGVYPPVRHRLPASELAGSPDPLP